MAKEWIKNLKPGDTVIVESKYRLAIKKVTKVTPTGRIVIGDSQYNPDGYLRGTDMYNREYILEATPEQLEKTQNKITRVQSLNKIGKFDFNKMDNESLLKIIEIIENSISK